jgi:hypothetical protein
VVARAYRIQASQGRDTRELDLFLGLRGWEDRDDPTQRNAASLRMFDLLSMAFPNRQELIAEQMFAMASLDFPFFEPAVAADADAIIKARVAELPEPIYVPETSEEAAANWKREEAELKNQEDDNGEATR